MTFHILDTVRVAQLLAAEREVDGSSATPPQPRPGEMGTVVETLGDDLYLVERVTDDGLTVWIAEFHARELTLVSRPAMSD